MPRVTVLSGGVGGGRFLAGLLRTVDPAGLTAIVNTGDDERIRGLHVSADVDSVLYHLSGECDWQRGWGIEGETFRSNERYAKLAAAAGLDVKQWFGLGDLDLATHQFRTALLDSGRPLAEATDVLRRAMGIACRVLPMTDDPAPTVVVTRDRERLAFEEYFVGRRQEVDVASVDLSAASSASPAPGALEAVREADVVVLTPSNPVVSIGPILAVPALREAVARAGVPRVGVSPIVGGRTIKGPAARLMESLGHDATALGAARFYEGLLDVWVMDEADAGLAGAVAGLGMRPVVLDTIMRSAQDAARLAKQVMEAL